MLTTGYFLILIIFLIIVYYEWRRRKYFQNNGCYDLFRIPIIGITYKFWNQRTIYKKTIEIIRDYHDKPMAVHLLHKTMVFVYQPDKLEKILSSTKIIDKSQEYQILHRWLGSGLLTGTGSKWRRERKILTPSFHYKILEDYVTIFERAGNILVDKLSTQLDEKPFDVFTYCTKYTLDVICETAMGINIDAQRDTGSDFVKAIDGMCFLFLVRSVVLPLRYEFLYRLTTLYFNEVRCLEILHNLSNRVIQERKAVLATKKTSVQPTNIDDDVGLKRRSNFIDVLLESNMTDEEIIEQVNTFIFAGHETTAVSLSFTIYELSKNPKIQQKVYEEVISVIGTDGEITLEKLQKLKYLEMVIKETLRRYPPVPLYTREMKEDYELEPGMVYPKGTIIGISAIGMHHNPSVYPDPTVFDPERFTLENMTKRHPYSFIPFSAGPRNCIGQKFALLELKSSLSKILRKFRIVEAWPGFEVEVYPLVTLRSRNGFQVRLEKRL